MKNESFVVFISPILKWAEACGVVCTLLLCAGAIAEAPDERFSRGRQFIGIDDFSAFQSTSSSQPGAISFLSPIIETRIEWDQLVPSWNISLGREGYLWFEARAIYPEDKTRFYILGLWSNAPERFPRQSVNFQKDENGTVLTDTLILKRPARAVQLRITLGPGRESLAPELKFLGLSLLDVDQDLVGLEPKTSVWGTSIPVPKLCQYDYPGGEVWCSPTSTSMILSHWGTVRHERQRSVSVPQAVEAIYDPAWPGTGNWPFNTAFAGAQLGIRAYTTRLSDLFELEQWIGAGVPVALSVSYDLLKGKAKRGRNDGHLVVCVGFTETGDVIVNDPARKPEVRCEYSRENVERAWSESHRTVYLIYPLGHPKPLDRFGHWAP